MTSLSRVGTPLAELFGKVHVVLGPPEEVFQLPDESEGIPIDVLIYRPPQLPFDLYLTLGVSLHEQGNGEGSRVEYYSKVRKGLSADQRREFARSLWVLAQWPFRGEKRQPMTAWHTLGGLSPLVQGSSYEGFLLKPAPSMDSPIQALQRELEGVQILEAIGLTLEEFLQLHVTSGDPQEHLLHVKQFASEQRKDPVIQDLSPGETPTVH